MLCAKYDYKMDIAVKKQEATEEVAKNFIKMNVLTDEQIAHGTGLPIQRIKELINELHKK